MDFIGEKKTVYIDTDLTIVNFGKLFVEKNNMKFSNLKIGDAFIWGRMSRS